MLCCFDLLSVAVLWHDVLPFRSKQWQEAAALFCILGRSSGRRPSAVVHMGHVVLWCCDVLSTALLLRLLLCGSIRSKQWEEAFCRWAAVLLAATAGGYSCALL